MEADKLCGGVVVFAGMVGGVAMGKDGSGGGRGRGAVAVEAEVRRLGNRWAEVWTHGEANAWAEAAKAWGRGRGRDT